MMLADLLTQHPAAMLDIARATPTWVWGLLAGLVALGASQLRQRTATRGRVLATPVAMTIFAAYGIWSAFGAHGWGSWALGAWLVTALLGGYLLLVIDPCAPQGTRWDAAAKRYTLPGSVVPLVLILTVFLTKYVVGVELAMRPQAAALWDFALPVSVVYGLASGIFMARTLRLMLLLPAKRRTASPANVSLSTS